MKTSSKYRKFIRQRTLKRQRRVAFMIVLIGILMIGSVAFSNYSKDGANNEVTVVTVHSGDTLWSIAKEYKPDNMSINEFVYEISASNGVKDGNIYCGQTLYIPA